MDNEKKVNGSEQRKGKQNIMNDKVFCVGVVQLHEMNTCYVKTYVRKKWQQSTMNRPATENETRIRNIRTLEIMHDKYVSKCNSFIFR